MEDSDNVHGVVKAAVRSAAELLAQVGQHAFYVGLWGAVEGGKQLAHIQPLGCIGREGDLRQGALGVEAVGNVPCTEGRGGEGAGLLEVKGEVLAASDKVV